jgi:hypothetical protein
LNGGLSRLKASTYHRTTQTQNKRTQMSMSRMEFEPKIPAFKPAKTVHALDNADTVIGEVCDQLTANLLYSYITKTKLVFGPQRSRIDVLEFITTTNRGHKNIWLSEKEKSLNSIIQHCQSSGLRYI